MPEYAHWVHIWSVSLRLIDACASVGPNSTNMRILHTADWHLGKTIKGVDFQADMELFFTWLLDTIREQSIDVLLVSGDVFDLANPSQQSLNAYYNFLLRLLQTRPACSAVITAGNHDAPGLLDAPGGILRLQDLHVVGAVRDHVADHFVAIRKGTEAVVVAAVPFLRDKDIRSALPGEGYQDKIEQTRIGIARFFQRINAHYTEHFAGVPYILMGHLFAQGVQVSESEREVQVGNLAGVEAGIFGDEPHYVALGHIHKPQYVGSYKVRYAGSPIPLSFSERNDRKTVVLLETREEGFFTRLLEVPVFRRFVRFEGTLASVKQQMADHAPEHPLGDLAELVVTEPERQVGVIDALQQLELDTRDKRLRVIHTDLRFQQEARAAADLIGPDAQVEDLDPVDIFRMIAAQHADMADNQDILLAFKEVYAAVLSELKAE